MLIDPIPFRLKDGREAVLRCPTAQDAEAFVKNYRVCVAETPFLNLTPEEAAGITLEDERRFIEGYTLSPDALLLSCFVDGVLAGTCDVTFHTNRKSRHRCGVGICIQSRFWGLGIGTAMFEAMIRAAEAREGVTQLELDFYEGNARARALYEKMGFRIVSCHPDAVRLPDGSFRNAYLMIRNIER